MPPLEPPVEAFRGGSIGRRCWDRPRTLWRDYISLEQQGGKLLEQVAGVREVLDCCWMDGCAYIIIEDSVGRLVLETVPDPILGVPHIKTLQKLFCKTLNYSCSSPRDLYSLNLR